LLIVLTFLFLAAASWPLVRAGITALTVSEDPLQPVQRVVIENWVEDPDMFEEARPILESVGKPEVCTIMFDKYYRDPRKRQAAMLNARSAGLDTSKLFLIPVPMKDPKTLNIARAVLDTAHSRGWKEVTILTLNMHSARSRKAYELAAKPYGITIRVFTLTKEGVTPENWDKTSVGLTMVFSELVKKIYYELVVF
jgi:hypothetical protein